MTLSGVIKFIDMIVDNNSNRTSLYSKCRNIVPCTHSFSYQRNRRLAYQQRLYFEYEYTKKVGGQAFFYTLTYNDNSIPTYQLGNKSVPCFSYKDIRKVTVGSLEKTLKRKYGSKLRYFCACETGEGNGKRGLGNNPHYHFIFFVQPFNEDYKPIDPREFRNYVRQVWQGDSRFVDFKNARFGIAREGDNLGLVVNATALKYVSKYVLKDASEVQFEKEIADYCQKLLLENGVTPAVISYYCNDWCKEELDSCIDVNEEYALDKYQQWLDTTTDSYDDKSYTRWVTRYCSDLHVKVNLVELYKWFEQYFVPEQVALKVNEYRNEYSGKVRCSKSLGEYGLNFVINGSTDPKIGMSLPDGYEIQPLCLYYYRKLYYKTYKCDRTGNVLYRLNDKGVQLHLYQLKSCIENHKNRVKEDIGIIIQNKHLGQFKTWFQTSVNFDLSDDLLYKYSVYKKVYEFRGFDVRYDMSGPDDLFSFDLAYNDYKCFIENDAYLFDWQIQTVFWKRSAVRTFQSYENHPIVKQFSSVFKFLDDLYDFVEDFRSDVSKRKFEDNADRQKRINRSKFT